VSLLTTRAIDHDSLIRQVLRSSDGAVVFFAGVVRDHHEGRAVEAIEYQAYESMARKEMARVIDTVAREHDEVRIAVVHRLGLLEVGQTSIAIACASPHRAEAFEACRKVIDRIKETVPIWKREIGPDGSAWTGWQGGTVSREREDRA
jgi:molybdopterin synthase catalytic subunit